MKLVLILFIFISACKSHDDTFREGVKECISICKEMGATIVSYKVRFESSCKCTSLIKQTDVQSELLKQMGIQSELIKQLESNKRWKLSFSASCPAFDITPAYVQCMRRKATYAVIYIDNRIRRIHCILCFYIM